MTAAKNLYWANQAEIQHLAVAGWITPLIAGVGMAASSLAVVLNALRLQAAGTRHGSRSAPREFGRQLLTAR